VMGLKDLARALGSQPCPAGTALSVVPVGQQQPTHQRTTSDNISRPAGKPVPPGTREATGTSGTTGTDGTNGTAGTSGTRPPVFGTLPPSPEPDAYTLAEREALAADRCPAEYLATWARFQLVRPRWALEGEWLEAIEGAGRFLDQWGAEAAAYGWTPEQIFGRDGLAFALRGATVRALGRRHADLDDGRRTKSR
jgi:hypothetical protein